MGFFLNFQKMYANVTDFDRIKILIEEFRIQGE